MDCSEGKAWITEARINNLKAQLDAVITAQRIDPKDLQSLAGSLNYVSRVCPTCRAFMRRLYDAVHASASTWLSQDVRAELLEDVWWWRTILDRWDGMAIIDNRPNIELWTDAATTKGLGAHLGPRERTMEVMTMVILSEK